MEGPIFEKLLRRGQNESCSPASGGDASERARAFSPPRRARPRESRASKPPSLLFGVHRQLPTACRPRALARLRQLLLTRAQSVLGKLTNALFFRAAMNFADGVLMNCSAAMPKLAIMHHVVHSAASHSLVKQTIISQAACGY